MEDSTWFEHETVTDFLFLFMFSPYPTIVIVLISF